jgi:hypothetical protein
MSPILHQGQPFLHRDLEEVGLSRADLRSALACGDVVRVFDRVYQAADTADTLESRVAAAKLAVPQHAVISDETAAWIWGADVHRPSERHRFVPHWVVPHGESRSRVDGISCRQALLSPDDVVEVDGLAVTRPVRTAADLLRKQYRPHALASADALARVGAIRAMDVRAYLVDLKGYRGIRQARVLAQYIDAGAASPGESWTRLRMIDAGFPKPQTQLEVVDAAGVRRYLDLAYARRRIGVEYDGRGFHPAPGDVVHDADRRIMLEALGYTIVVVRYEDVWGNDARFEQNLGEILGITPIGRWW